MQPYSPPSNIPLNSNIFEPWAGSASGVHLLQAPEDAHAAYVVELGEGCCGGDFGAGSERTPVDALFMSAMTYQPTCQDSHAALRHQYEAIQAPGPRTTDVVCLLVGGHCPGHITLSPRTVKRNIVQHLSVFHGIPTCSAADALVGDCAWLGCACSIRGRRCRGHPHGHPAHVKDLAEHIMHSHLDILYACDKCGRAEWSTPYALSRHRRMCRGKAAVRCAGCLELFVSRVALEGHVERQVCYASTA